MYRSVGLRCSNHVATIFAQLPPVAGIHTYTEASIKCAKLEDCEMFYDVIGDGTSFKVCGSKDKFEKYNHVSASSTGSILYSYSGMQFIYIYTHTYIYILSLIHI